MAREARIRKEFTFDGQWIPDHDPLLIGEKNFAALENFRYVDGGIEPIEGYTEINTTALTTYLKARSGIQLRSPFTQKTYVVLELWNADLTAARIGQNKTDIPDQGDFEAAYLYTPATGAAKGRFGSLPRGIGYCNEHESCIWDGDEMRAGAIFVIDSITGLTATNPIDYTEILSNSLSTAANRVTAVDNLIIASTRPLQGFKIYISSGNALASAMTVKEWQGSWSAALTITDNTDTGPSLAATGTVTWTATGLAVPAYFQGVYLYLYHMSIDAGSATVYQVTVDAPFQTCKDIWDGVYRECAQFQFFDDSGSGFQDFSLEILEESNDEYPIAAKIGAMQPADKIRVMFEDRTTAIRFEMLAATVNTTVSAMAIAYWNGSAYIDVGTIYDGTKDSGGTKTFNQTGVVSWNPPAAASEAIKTEFGVTGFSYEITVNVQLSGAASTDILVDLVYGIPAQKTIRGHSFPSRFQGHAMWCGDIVGNEQNRVDYTLANAPDVHNGDDSSDHGQSLYFGGSEKLTCATSLFNRFGANIYETWLCFKESETYLLDGVGPEDFRIYQISQNYGCPAPGTLAAAETGYEVGEDTLRNVAIWLSYRGPVIFDGTVVIPLRGVDLYFDTRKDTCIEYENIANSQGWFDSYWMEYNLQIPSGSGQSTLNVWLVYNLRLQRWYQKKVAAAASYPQLGLIVRDEQGVTYQYLTTDDGIMHRGEYGTTWNGVNIQHLVRMADHIPAGSIFDESTIHQLRVLHQIPDFDNTTQSLELKIKHYLNGGEKSTILDSFLIQKADYLDIVYLVNEDDDYLVNEDDDYLIANFLTQDRYAVHQKSYSLQGLSHQFEFWRDSDSYAYLGTFGKALLAFGYVADLSRSVQ